MTRSSNFRGASMPEGFCRNYADAIPTVRGASIQLLPIEVPPRKVRAVVTTLAATSRAWINTWTICVSLGITTIYFNPIFDAGSNHSYDTQDYYKVDPYFGTQQDWDNLVKHAQQRGMNIVLDGVFNHLSSDSPFFDRYHHYAGDGACESLLPRIETGSLFHDVAAGTGTCVGSSGEPNSATYDGWFGFDTIPVINKSLPAVQAYFLTDDDSVSHLLAEPGRERLAPGCDGRCILPGRLLGNLPRRGQEDQTRCAHHQRDLAKGQHPPAHAARRPRRHHDELSPARCRDRVAGAAAVRLEGLCR